MRFGIHKRCYSRLKSVSHSVVSDFFATPWTTAPPGSLVHGMLQARTLEWAAIPFPRVRVKEQHQIKNSVINILLLNWTSDNLRIFSIGKEEFEESEKSIKVFYTNSFFSRISCLLFSTFPFFCVWTRISDLSRVQRIWTAWFHREVTEDTCQCGWL